MKKKLFLFFLVALSLSIAACNEQPGGINASAEDSSENPQGLAFYLTDDGTYYVGKGLSTLLSNIVIPSTYKGRPVTGIISNGFSDSKVVSITIPDSITSIDSNAFYNCSSLTSITITGGVISIGSFAFYNCSSLTSITIPDSLVSIGGSAFYGCSSLKSITIPDSVASIDSYAFLFCPLEYNEYDNGLYIGNSNNPYVALMKAKSNSISSCSINKDCKIIYGNAFYNCPSLTSITIPDSVISTGGNAFYNCPSLEYNEYDNGLYIGNSNNPYVALIKAKSTSISSCTINKDCKNIFCNAFYNCSSLSSITITGGVISIGSFAFYNCSSLTSITIPDSVTKISDSAFCKCSSLTSIAIPDSVTSIGSNTFSNCSSLTSITIPDSVTKIRDSVFSNCSHLKNVFYCGSAADWSYVIIANDNFPLTSATRYYYSETEPTESGNYWHYVDGVPTIW